MVAPGEGAAAGAPAWGTRGPEETVAAWVTRAGVVLREALLEEHPQTQILAQPVQQADTPIAARAAGAGAALKRVETGGMVAPADLAPAAEEGARQTSASVLLVQVVAGATVA